MSKLTDYFNTPEYLAYLKKNFEIKEFSATEREDTCKRPDVDLIFNYTNYMGISAGESLLEIGCGLGRLLNFFSKHYKIKPSGVDVSEEATRYAKEHLPIYAENIRCCKVENLPFDDCYFDHILCWAVFDLTQQGVALSQMMRVLKVGGTLLLTGKNDLFAGDDEDALVAEIRSREKNIPNHYTDYGLFKRAVEINGGCFEIEHFFLRRGDFMLGKYLVNKPDNFIEYCVVVRKIDHKSPVILKIAENFSKTWNDSNAK